MFDWFLFQQGAIAFLIAFAVALHLARLRPLPEPQTAH